MKIKIITILVCTIILIFLCSCEAKMTIITDSGSEYSYEETNVSYGGLYLMSGDYYKADADTLRSFSQVDSKENVSVPADAKEAAQIGASVLDTVYDNWSENGSVVVHFNETANAWIVHGQLPDRNSAGKTGTIAIEATTGEILCIVSEESGT